MISQPPRIVALVIRMGAVIVLPDSTSKSAMLMVVAGTSGIERNTITLKQISLTHPDIALKK